MTAALASPSRGRPTARDFRSNNRGGGLFTETVNQWVGGWLSVAADRLRLPPTALSLTNLFLSFGGSVAVVVLAPRMAAGDVPAWAVAVGAWLAWQLAYSLDCADGQLARVTGQTSPAGARVDVLADVAAQSALVTALASVAVAYRPETPTWLVALFAATWMVNLITSVLATGPAAQSLVPSRTPAVRVVKLVRDYGATLTTGALVLGLVPAYTVWLLVAFSVVNGLFLLSSIAAAARASLRERG